MNVAADPVHVANQNEDGSWKYTNELIDETSPYLLQHAHNPVDWHAWNPKAFALAKQTGKPIFLSIGYSTCYWCHVMERQVFENPKIAQLMNKLFINIKVDREERPDVDDIYMMATQLMTQSGGWPMSVFLTPPQDASAHQKADPGLKPFFAGTYIPPTPQHGRPGFPQVLQRMHDAWTNQREKVLEVANNVAQAVKGYLTEQSSPQRPDPALVGQVVDQLMASYDPTHGGFGGGNGGPKFPQPANLLLMIRKLQHQPNKNQYQALVHTLDRMAQGGMYDQIGGGFHRYSIDEKWLVPHFEKMLYDNGQLLETYANMVGQASGLSSASTAEPSTQSGVFPQRPVSPPTKQADSNDLYFYKHIIHQTCQYVLREMTDPTGAFWSAQDAEVDAKEGDNYVWTTQQIQETLENQNLSQIAIHMYGLDQGTNFKDPHNPQAKNVNVLFLPQALDQLHQEQKISLSNLYKQKAQIDSRLLNVRDKRKQPRLDDKVLVSWNGLMIAGLAKAGHVLDKPQYIQAAQQATNAILTHMRKPDQGLYRSMRQKQAKIPAFLEDYAFFVHGLLELYRATQNPDTLKNAKQLMAYAFDHFAVDGGAGGAGGTSGVGGGYFDTLENQTDLFVRTRGLSDGAIPSGNSQMIHNLLDLYELTAQKPYLDRAITDLDSFAKPMEQRLSGMVHMVHALLRASLIEPGLFKNATTKTQKVDDKHVQVSIEPATAQVIDHAVDVQIKMHIDKPYHINAHQAEHDWQIATELKLIEAGEMTLQVSYPQAQTLEVDFTDMPISIYQGNMTIKAQLSHAGTWPQQVKFMLTYQVCDDKQCYAPQAKVLTIRVKK